MNGPPLQDNFQTTLPSGWAFASVDQLCAINPGLTKFPADNDLVSFVPMTYVSDVTGEIINSDTKTYGSIKSGYTQFQNGDVLFAKITPCMENGKTAVARDLVNGIGFGSTEFYVLRSRGAIQPEFLHRFIRQHSYRKQAQYFMRGTAGHARVPREFFSRVLIPVPPLNEQKRIIEVLREFDDQIRNVRSQLIDFPASLKQARRSLLATALTGRLTQNRNVEDFDEWREFRIREVIRELQQGWSPRCENIAALPNEWGIIKTTAIQPTFFIDGENKRLPSHLAPEESLEIKQGDILITRKGPRTRAGVAAYVQNTRPKLMVCDTAFRIRTEPKLCDAKFLAFLLNSPPIEREIDKLKNGISESGVGFTQNDFLSLRVSIPSLSTQRKITAQLESSFASLEATSNAYTEASETLDRLEQAMLVRAFSGQLVKQDSNDPAIGPIIAESLKSYSLNSPELPKRMRRTAKKQKKLQARSILEVLNDDNKLKPEELFHACGRDESDLEQVEKFYSELKGVICQQMAIEVRPDDETILISKP